MSLIIRDPLDGTGARVIGTEGRLRTQAQTIPVGSDETEHGNGYNVNTGTIVLTSGDESVLLYILNNGENPIVVDLMIFLLGVSNITGVDSFLRIYRNPSAGTLISAGTPLSDAALNRNYGSANNLDATILVGAEASTITASDGVNVQAIVVAPARVILNVGSIVIPRSAAIALSVEPPTGNTAQNVQCALQVFTDTVNA